MKTVLITGTSSGFGEKIVKTLVEDNQEFHIIATMRGKDDKNKESAQELAKYPNVLVKELDVVNQASINSTAHEVLSEYGKIDILINNAGVYGGGLLEAHSINQVQKLFDVNVYGPLRLMKAILPAMRKEKRGLIINISSMLGFFSIPMNAVYCASKFALEGFVTGSYDELIQKGVENVLVEPGAYPTELFQKQGIIADENAITESYDGLAEQMTAYATSAVGRVMAEKQPNPQAVADKVVELIKMEKNTRPLRNPIDQISGEEFSHKVTRQLAALAQEQMKAYGF